MSARAKILLVDDDPTTLELVGADLRRSHDVIEATSCEGAVRLCERTRPDAAILDYQLPDGTALTLLERLREIDRELPVVILTAHGSIERAVEAIQRGADHFVTKPVPRPKLHELLGRLITRRRNRRRLTAYDANRNHSRPDPFLGRSAAMRRLQQRAHKFAASDRPVLLTGETGSGKGVLARWLHHHGPRAEEPFVDLNCAGLRPHLLESNLFGHARGAFTDATDDKPGLLEAADRGTLFLDEIGDLGPEIQAALLKVLEEQTFRRLGEVRERRVDVRLVVATNQSLERLVRSRGFRRDLYYRINTLNLEVPPLRRRREDVPSLAEHFLESFGRTFGRSDLRLSDAAVEELVRHGWPGNVRELRNVIERAALLGEDPTLGPGDLHFDADLGDDPEGDGLDLSLDEVQRRHIRRVLEREEGSVARAAVRLDVPRSTLYQKIRRYGIALPPR